MVTTNIHSGYKTFIMQWKRVKSFSLTEHERGETTEKPKEDTQVSDAPHFRSYSMVHKRGKLTSELPPSNPLLSCLPVLDL